MNTVLDTRPQLSFEAEAKDESQLVIKIEALKNLASLLLKHLESLEKNSLPTKIRSAAGRTNLFDEVQTYEAELISDALIRAKGSQRKAARMLGTKASTLNAKIKRYGIDPYGLVGRL